MSPIFDQFPAEIWLYNGFFYTKIAIMFQFPFFSFISESNRTLFL